MRRRDFLRGAGGAAVALIVSGLPTKACGPQGAVKTGLFLVDPEDDADGQAGWAVLNANAQNELIVQIHLAQGEPDTTHDVALLVEEDYWPELGNLTTNGQGKGNAHVVLPVAEYAEAGLTEIHVQVLLESHNEA